MENYKCCSNIKMILVVIIAIITAFIVGFYISKRIILNNVVEKNDVIVDNEVNKGKKVDNKFASEIVINGLKEGDSIKSPHFVSGKAKGIWFFEASFPIEVTDLDGNLLGQSYVQAEGDWMTEGFVNFTGNIEFDKGDNIQGYFVFKNANPSDIREFDKEHKILVEFE